MSEPALVADCIKAMRDAVDIPVTVKHRIGIDKIENYDFVRDFVGTVSEAGTNVFIVHTRNAWLKGLSPKENREIPPLKREFAYQLKKDFPELIFVINGAIQDLGQVEEQLKFVDGVMVGRAAYNTPWLLSDVDDRIYGDSHEPITREKVIEVMTEYLKTVGSDQRAVRAVCRHMHGLLTGLALAARVAVLLPILALQAHGKQFRHQLLARPPVPVQNIRMGNLPRCHGATDILYNVLVSHHVYETTHFITLLSVCLCRMIGNVPVLLIISHFFPKIYPDFVNTFPKINIFEFSPNFCPF